MKTHGSYYSRKFLNKSKGVALIEADAYFTDYELSAYLKLSDCNRNVSLEFYGHTDKDIKNRLIKLDTLIKEITDFRDWYEEASIKYLSKLAERKSKNDNDRQPIL